ncbi:MAG: carboxymuconolactone decarboxylase family protein [Deltaproteobacteria bacterium]|nr:MAG: carboxymuconolactone decarboxylase family protein [Deltaproteobacteria bacterium]
MVRVRDIEWEACLIEPRRDPELERQLRKQVGRLPGSMAYFSPCPWLPRVLAALNGLEFPLVHIDHHLADLVMLVVSQDNSCRYCYAAQRALLRVVGYPQSQIARLEQDFLTAELDPRQRAALDFARRVSRSNPLPSAADKQRLRDAGFSELAMKEVAGVVARGIFLNRVSTLPALPPERMEDLPDRWYVRLVGPLLSRKYRGLRRRGEPTKLREDEKTGPYAYLVLALDGLPFAGELRRVLDEMWHSPILSARAKALIFAVVARALGCPCSEQESTRLLLEEGLTQRDVDEILAHLASPKLDRVEAVVVPFARETIWYEAAQIQRRARALQPQLSAAEFIELIAVCGLANAVCRLGIITDAAG